MTDEAPSPTPAEVAKRKRLIDLVEQGTINALKKAKRQRARWRR